MASANLARTPSSAGSTTTGTFSFWIKGNLATGSNQNLYSVSDGTNTWQMWINVNGQLDFHAYNGSSYVARIHPGRKLKDTNGWYHIVCTIDTTNATAGDRLRLYINGERYTGPWTAEVQPTQNLSVIFCKNSTTRIGSEWNNSDYFEGNMAHFHLIDGTAYDASAFGESDSNGVWKPKTAPSVTYGTNGFFLKFDNSGNMGLDSSGQSNNWTTSGTIIQNKDTPSNVFATMNPLQFNSSAETFSDGNNTLVSTGGGSWTTHYGFSTLAMGSGKYYVEMKADNTGTSGQSYPIGLIDVDQNITSSLEDNGLASIRASSGDIVGSSFTNQTGLTAVSAGDILAIAYDGVNGTLQFYRNGSTHGTAITGIDTSKDYYVACDTYEGSSNFKYNFGNGYFGTTAVSSAGTNASNNGIFEYDVPTGYTALSTKGLDS